MRAHGRIDAAGSFSTGVHDIVQHLAHTVQALELEPLGGRGHLQNCGHGMGIMGGKLWINTVRHAQKFTRIGNITDIGGHFAGKDRKRAQAQNLGALDLGVPIGAFDQPHHHFAVVLLGQIIKPVYSRRGAPTIGLHHHAKS